MHLANDSLPTFAKVCHPHARHVCHLAGLAAATSVVVQKDTFLFKLAVCLQNGLLPVLAPSTRSYLVKSSVEMPKAGKI